MVFLVVFLDAFFVYTKAVKKSIFCARDFSMYHKNYKIDNSVGPSKINMHFYIGLLIGLASPI